MKCEWWSHWYDGTWVTVSSIPNTNMRFRCLLKWFRACYICDVNALFDGNVGVKVWKGCMLS